MRKTQKQTQKWKMQEQRRSHIPKIILAAKAVLFAITTVFLAFPVRVSAAGGTVLPVEIFGKDVVSVGVPVISEGETSPFDFILDPQELLYETDAMRYGGGTVEEGTTLLFRNTAGGYDFSRYSDKLTVTNQSTVPVKVTISASVSNLEDVSISGSDDFSGNESQSIYLALVDDEGNVQPISANGDTTFSWVMQAAPENAYVYTINEEDHTYECVLSGSPETIGFDTYSFGLVGACNPNVDWKNRFLHPVVTVIWRVDPILPEQDESVDKVPDKEEEKPGDESESEDVWEVLRQKDIQEKESIPKEIPVVKPDPTEEQTTDNTADSEERPVSNASDNNTGNNEVQSTNNASDSKTDNNGAGTTGNTSDNKTDIEEVDHVKTQ